ncbi:SpoIIE family protein phosphatase [Pseudonocardia sp. GCM10023141]|uniref:SpoIIE family protein phosphatase n=1 Tax=Pseudonocardia sp. GCM10023141 TaxID=3252653 RepID=UPI0036159763
MDAVTSPSAEDVAWLVVQDASAIGGARRSAEHLAEQLGLPASRVAEVGLAVTEIATNLHRHAHSGAILLRALRDHRRSAVEVVAMDSGPGITDIEAALRDGASTGGTLGIGLGAISRLANQLDISSHPDRGTVLVARFEAAKRGRSRHPVEDAGDIAGITRALGGEDICGDAYGVRREAGRVYLMLCDGSGHGPLAAMAAREAVRAFETTEQAFLSPESAVRRIHSALTGTRGGAVAVAELDARTGSVHFVGVGNISGAVIHPDGKRSMTSIGGVAGYRRPTFRTFDYPLPAGAMVVLHSDGVRADWLIDDVRSLLERPPLLLAATLLRDSGVRQDDASVLVGVAHGAPDEVAAAPVETDRP